MKKTEGKIVIVVLVIVVVALLGYIIWKNTAVAPAPIDETPSQTVPAIEGDTANFVAFSVAPGATVSGVVTATGTITGAYFFEANIRVNILDANKNVLKQGNGTATTEWMTGDAVSFTTTLDFTGIPAGSGYVRIMNDNPSGEPANDKYIDIPVIFQ